jgi:hypothetical protein
MSEADLCDRNVRRAFVAVGFRTVSQNRSKRHRGLPLVVSRRMVSGRAAGGDAGTGDA